MSSVTSIIIAGVVLSLAIAVFYAVKRYQRFKVAEQTIASFFEFNREVAQQLHQLEEQGRLCYQSLDGEAMRLMYEAQKLIQHGRELEQLGFQALSSGNKKLLDDVETLYDLEDEEERVVNDTTSLGDLTPRAYKHYADQLLCRIEEKIRVGIENRKKLYSCAA